VAPFAEKRIECIGSLFAKLRQLKVGGEIFAGVVLGTALIGRFHFAFRLIEVAAINPTADSASATEVVAPFRMSRDSTPRKAQI
jgi:Kef-type K+ transport system membrane component KefB